jgi:predicted alpha/beta superfamily hydrolase
MDSHDALVIPGIDVLRPAVTAAGGPVEVYVTLQGSPEAGERLPVVYVLDANAWFVAVTQMAGVLQTYNELPALCVVGIGYPVGNPYTDRAASEAFYARRQPDLSPVRDPEYANWQGGGPEFLRYLVDEVIPVVEARYGVDATRRMLFGDSLSGDFGLYAMLARPGVFQGVVAGSPSLHRPLMVAELERLAASLVSAGARLETRAFVAYGEMEPDRPRDMEQALGFLRPLEGQGLRVEVVVFEGETHASVWPATFSRGLRWLLG